MHRASLRRTSRNTAAGLLVGWAVYLAVGCAPPEDRQVFVERLGVDTISIESYTRSAEGFEGDVVIRSPHTLTAHYQASLTADGAISRMEVEWRTPPANPEARAPWGYVVTIEGDSATLERRGGRDPGTTRMAVPPGTIPLIGKTPVAFAVFEQAVRQALASGLDNYPVHFLSVGRGRIMANAIIRTSPDSVSMDFFGSPILAEVSADGRVLGRSGERTTFKAVGERVDAVDLAALTADFAARDARGEGFGVASPQATVEATIDGANLTVVYSRPAKRGREIWGALVPYDEIWRTGANAATAFTTDRDLEIGGAHVPAGAYTLYSIFTPESAQLIINQQTGQWGTMYDEGQDLVRVDLTQETVAEAVQRFTISIEPGEGGGVLQLTWDRSRFSVPVRVR
ncbi:MAG: DUF2911 domain-containing protein [Gemmatimonadota bacterium]|nr:MAG: DUF2911 domain-containing protein [Gemmatimonadota bacterium]